MPDAEKKVGDLVEIVTPATLKRRIETLGVAWRTLAIGSKAPLVKSEYQAWLSWKKDTLASDFNLWSGSAVSSELDDWQKRYRSAYESARASGPVAAPAPGDIGKPGQAIPWYFWVGGGIGIAALIYVMVKK